jgi:hypothetical protein
MTEGSGRAIEQPENYVAADVFERVSRHDTLAVETTGTAGEQSFSGTVVEFEREELLGDADRILIDVESRVGFWTIHAERSSSDDAYGPLYADGSSAGQRVKSIEVVEDE